ncbi:MAG TPA: hypothetical protein DEB39_00690, partial [Planctomycetaceae bacterium]|nr:hypothetical protein [Planctomycetaceae bacterium]
PTVAEIKAMQTKLEKLTKPLPKVYAAYYGEDWKTQGDWVGRYGRQYAVMCGANAPFDHNFQYNEDFFKVRGFIGPNRTDGDTIRRWVHWIKTDNPRSLYTPLAAYRRQSEWDDHGEAYSMMMDGPDLWYVLDVKNPGVYRLDMYFMNKDGHDGHNRHRDYMIEIYKSPTKQRWSDGLDWQIFSELAEHQVLRSPPLAKSRIRDFWGGVHKQFVVKGPEYYFVKIRKNYSFNTIVSLVALDRILGEETLHDRLGLSPWMGKVRCNPPEIPEHYTAQKATQARNLWLKSHEIADKQGQVGVYRKAQLTALRTARAPGYWQVSERRLYRALLWHLNQWPVEQRKTWEADMAEAWRQFGVRDPKYVKARDDFLVEIANRKSKPPSIWPSDTHDGANGIRIKIPEFKPVPKAWKRKPN